MAKLELTSWKAPLIADANCALPLTVPAAVESPPPPNPAVAAEALTAVSKLTPPFIMWPNEPVEVAEPLTVPVWTVAPTSELK